MNHETIIVRPSAMKDPYFPGELLVEGWDGIDMEGFGGAIKPICPNFV